MNNLSDNSINRIKDFALKLNKSFCRQSLNTLDRRIHQY